MEDIAQTKIEANGDWQVINLSEMARILQAENPTALIIATGKANDQEKGMDAATKEKRRLRKQV